MRLGLHQSARMEQRLIQSPQMIQAMQILQLPALDLVERIEQELNENPLLEKSEGGPEGGAESGFEGAGEGGAGESDPSVLDARLSELERFDRDRWADGRPARYSDDIDPKHEALQNAENQPKTLGEAISEELALSTLDDQAREVAEYIANSLDDRGFLGATPEEVAQECGVAGATAETVARALADLRHQIHPALAARDLRECLLLQLDAHNHHDSLVHEIVERHLDDVITNRLPRIAKATGRSLDEVVQSLEVLRSLDPSPGSSYAGASAAAITPDVLVEEIDGDYEVRLNRGTVPTLVLSPQYKEYLKLARKGEGERDWVRKRLESARWFIDAIQQRQSTLLRISEKVFAHQREFLERGVRGLKPLRMQEIADEVGVHISTVSRAVSGKYAQTPRGTLPLKYFFTGGTETDDGEVESQASIKQRIAELVSKEDRSNPLSDDQLAALLHEQDRIQIARRTVTKYRKALQIPSSTQRKTF
ncbi:MAG: RNA polymerase factor sigma-54 [Planctomycetaceae bacterium]|nr:RNA polymerase factor sigma-54 [Planctomycetaceae bacterium]